MNPAQWQDERFQHAYPWMEELCHLTRSLQEKHGVAAVQKEDASPVTVADLAVQVVLAIRLRQHFPNDQLVAEESADPLKSDPGLLRSVREQVKICLGPCTDEDILNSLEPRRQTDSPAWILDPIDGTKGFLRGDQFAIALALREENQLKFGLLGCPRLSGQGSTPGGGVIAAAYKEQGSWQQALGSSEWSRIQVSDEAKPHNARLLRSFEAAHTNESDIEAVARGFSIQADPVRMDSQAKYVLLARGDAEAVMRCLAGGQRDYKEKVWDQAAGALVVSEAGGVISDLNGRELDFSCSPRLLNNTGILATNGVLHDPFLQALKAL